MVGGDENAGIAPGQGGVVGDRSWLQIVGAGGEGTPGNGHVDPGLADTQDPRCLPSPSQLIREQKLKAAEWGGRQGRGQRTWVKEEWTDGPLFSNQKWMLQELEWWLCVCVCVCVCGVCVWCAALECLEYLLCARHSAGPTESTCLVS